MTKEQQDKINILFDRYSAANMYTEIGVRGLPENWVFLQLVNGDGKPFYTFGIDTDGSSQYLSSLGW